MISRLVTNTLVNNIFCYIPNELVTIYLGVNIHVVVFIDISKYIVGPRESLTYIYSYSLLNCMYDGKLFHLFLSEDMSWNVYNGTEILDHTCNNYLY